MKIINIIVIIGLTAGWSQVSFSQTDDLPVGYILDIRDSHSEYSIRRGSVDSPVEMLAPVFSGDIITVNEPSGLVVIGVSSNRQFEVGYDDSPYRVEEEGTIALIANSVLDVVRGVFESVNDEATSTYTAGPEFRGACDKDPSLASATIVVPVLMRRVGGLERITEGNRLFGLTWTGGQPPYEVHLVRDADEMLLIDEEAPCRQLVGRSIGFVAGSHRLDIVDAAGHIAEFPLEVVSASALPERPSTIGAMPSAELATVVDAAWLAFEHGGDEWKLESLLMLLPIAADFEPARALANALLAGRARR